MRKEYSSAVRKTFDAKLKARLPQFELSKVEGNQSRSGRVYQYAVKDDLVLFIHLMLHDNAEEFTVTIGFSQDNVLPEETWFAEPKEASMLPGLCFRLPEFWSDKDPWWIIDPYLSVAEEKARLHQRGTLLLPEQEYSTKIQILVDDVSDKLFEYAIPYFEVIVAPVRQDGRRGAP